MDQGLELAAQGVRVGLEFLRTHPEALTYLGGAGVVLSGLGLIRLGRSMSEKKPKQPGSGLPKPTSPMSRRELRELEDNIDTNEIIKNRPVQPPRPKRPGK